MEFAEVSYVHDFFKWSAFDYHFPNVTFFQMSNIVRLCFVCDKKKTFDFVWNIHSGDFLLPNA